MSGASGVSQLVRIHWQLRKVSGVRDKEQLAFWTSYMSLLTVRWSQHGCGLQLRLVEDPK
jgi:hypothetical protein